MKRHGRSGCSRHAMWGWTRSGKRSQSGAAPKRMGRSVHHGCRSCEAWCRRACPECAPRAAEHPHHISCQQHTRRSVCLSVCLSIAISVRYHINAFTASTQLGIAPISIHPPWAGAAGEALAEFFKHQQQAGGWSLPCTGAEGIRSYQVWPKGASNFPHQPVASCQQRQSACPSPRSLLLHL